MKRNTPRAAPERAEGRFILSFNPR